MSIQRTTLAVLACLFLLAAQAAAGDIVGTAVDLTGGVLPGARVTLLNLTTGQQSVVVSDEVGRFSFEQVANGTYQVSVELDGFARSARTVSVTDGSRRVDLAFRLAPGAVDVGVTVTATRGERGADLVPIRTESIARDAVHSRSPLSTGEAMVATPGITPVGSGPLQVRPRLRGLDSTRLLVLVDGERLNNARTATDRSGTEVALVDLFTVDNIEIVRGSGSVLYGTDALGGTINIRTNQPEFSDRFKTTYGFDGYASSNESGRRGTASVGVSSRRFAVRFAGTVESFDDYRAGGSGASESTARYFADGTLHNQDTIDDNFGFSFKAFPDPFNQPYTRSSAVVPTSGAKATNVNVSGLMAITASQTLEVKYLRRRMENVGFPDFEAPVFFSRVTLPSNDLDRFSVRYEVRALTSWFTNLKMSAYYQDHQRLLRNEFPVQFPVPSPRFFPISVFRLDLTTETNQHVRTPGLDIQGTLVPARHHIVTAGVMSYRDWSVDSRTNSTATSIIGDVSLGSRGPQASVYPSPLVLGPPSVTHPVRVPDASFSDLGAYVQDEWDVNRYLRVVAGLRLDRYRVTTRETPGYDIDSLVQGAVPAIDPGTLPNPGGDRISRTAATGDVGVVIRPNDAVSFQARYGRSYRHPNLEELLFSGPATVGAIVPNIEVKPETGHNVDLGMRLRAGRFAGSVTYFNNTYKGFISTEIVAVGPSDPLSQAINFTDVRIQGVEADVDLPIVLRPGVVTLFGNVAYTRGQILAGTNRLTGDSLAGTPQDNITPFKGVFGGRFTDVRDRFWLEYSARVQSKVDRVAVTLIDSPYLIAQDLLSLNGFAVQRLAAGINFRGSSGRLGLVVAVENLAGRFYREQFQFAPARGRSFTIGLHVRGL